MKARSPDIEISFTEQNMLPFINFSNQESLIGFWFRESSERECSEELKSNSECRVQN